MIDEGIEPSVGSVGDSYDNAMAETVIGLYKAELIHLPFGEWTNIFPEPRLCKAVVDRLTFHAHIIETGNDSWRFKQTVERRKGGRKTA